MLAELAIGLRFRRVRLKTIVPPYQKEVKFMPLVVIEDTVELEKAEHYIFDNLEKENFSKPGYAREWFHANDHQGIEDIVRANAERH